MQSCGEKVNIATESINGAEEEEEEEEESYIKSFHGIVVVVAIFKNMVLAKRERYKIEG